MTEPNSEGVFLACHLAVKLSLQAAAKAVVNHRGRAERGMYRGVLADDLYRALTPAATSAELDRWEESFSNWWGLPSVLDTGEVPHIDLIMKTCHAYVRSLMLSQEPHDPNVLKVWLQEADRVAAARS